MAGTTGAPDARKSVGSKDAKKAKRFRGQDLTLPDREKESKAEAEAEQKLIDSRKRLASELPKDARYSLEIVERVLEYRRDGLTTLQISREPGMPHRQSIYEWLDDRPEFADQYEKAFDDRVRDAVELGLQTVQKMTEVKGLKGYNKVQAMDKQVMRSLQYAGVRLKDWKPDRESGGDTIVIEVSGGWNPAPATALPQDANGQGREAAAAADRWKAIREGAVDADSGAPAHPAEG